VIGEDFIDRPSGGRGDQALHESDVGVDLVEVHLASRHEHLRPR
jgi:hypothetical protein